MNSGFFPKVVFPNGYSQQTKSNETPFYFGGSQVPQSLGLSRHRDYVKGSGIHKKYTLKKSIKKIRLPFMK